MKHPLATPLRLLAIATIAAVPLLAAPRASAANDASITLSPTTGSVVKGGSISFTINVNHGSNPISSWKAFIKYSPSLFSGGSISSAGSPFNLPMESSVSGGNISLVYGTINGSDAFNYNGALATVTLNTTATGNASFGLEHNCAVAGDNACSAAYTTVVVNGNDTSVNVLGSTNTANFTITDPPAGGSGGSTGGGSTGGSTSSTTKKGSTTKSIAKATSGSPTAATTTPSTTPATTSAQDTDKETSIGAIVTLTLLDQNGKPVAGAKVTVDGVTVTTDKNGKATLANVSPGAVSGKVTYKGQTQTINLNVEDGSSQPTQAAKVSINVKKSNAATPIAITVGTLAVIAGAAYFIAGPGGGLSSLISKLPGIGGGQGPNGPKPPAPGATGGPTPPPTTPTPPAPTPPAASASATFQQPKAPHSTLPKHFDPTAPGTTFTPSQPTAIKIQ